MPELSKGAPTTMVPPLRATDQPNPLPLPPLISLTWVQPRLAAGVTDLVAFEPPPDGATRARSGRDGRLDPDRDFQ
jgi:hypothetical protein